MDSLCLVDKSRCALEAVSSTRPTVIERYSGASAQPLLDTPSHRLRIWRPKGHGSSTLPVRQNKIILRTDDVRFLAISEHIETDESNPSSRLLLHIVAAFEWERVVFDRSKAIEMHHGRNVYPGNRSLLGSGSE